MKLVQRYFNVLQYVTGNRLGNWFWFLAGPPYPDKLWDPHSFLPMFQWLPGIKRLECETDHLPPSSAQVKNVWSYTSLPHIHIHRAVFT